MAKRLVALCLPRWNSSNEKQFAQTWFFLVYQLALQYKNKHLQIFRISHMILYFYQVVHSKVLSTTQFHPSAIRKAKVSTLDMANWTGSAIETGRELILFSRAWILLKEKYLVLVSVDNLCQIFSFECFTTSNKFISYFLPLFQLPNRSLSNQNYPIPFSVRFGSCPTSMLMDF